MTIDVTKNTFDSIVVKSDKTVLVDFWASWCGPCKMLAPVIHQISEELDVIKVCKINVDEEAELAAAFGINTIPTLVVIKNGKEIGRSIGVQNKSDILKMIK